jgi:hypothetical protein
VALHRDRLLALGRAFAGRPRRSALSLSARRPLTHPWMRPNCVRASTLLSDPGVQQLAPAAHAWPNAESVRLVTYTRFFGATLDGQSVQSDEFSFPVDVCNGCLITFTNNPMLPIPNCAPGPNRPVPSMPCAIGEDLPTDCSACQDQSICRSADAG